MSHTKTNLSGLISKQIHNQVVGDIQKKLDKAIKTVEMAKEYIFSRRRKRNRDDDDMCFVMSCAVSELKETSPVTVTFGESDEAKLERFKMSVSPIDYARLQQEWELHKEAHNGFDCWLAYELLQSKKKINELVAQRDLK